MLVVSDTSPVRALNHLNLLGALHQLYGEVLVPPAVARELENPGPGFQPVRLAPPGLFRIQMPSSVSEIAGLRQTLDAGESEAIALAIEVKADFLLIDELAGRAVAMQRGLKPVGALGVLVRAKQTGLVPSVRDLMDRLRAEMRFFISEPLYSEILRLTGE